jgi:glycosyl transferase family 25
MREVEILLINMPSAEQRRRLMQAQLDLPGMPPYRIVDGVDGRRLDAARIAETYDEAVALRLTGERLTRPEIGCAASHRAAYRHIVDNDAAVAVVLEDDALLGSQFLKVLERLVKMADPGKPEVYLLTHVVRYSTWGKRPVDKTHCLCRPYEAYGAHGYLITRMGAQAMLAAFDRIQTASDDWQRFMRAGIVEVTALVPYVVGTSPLSNSSQIGERTRDSARRAARRGWFAGERLLFQLFLKPALRLRKQEQTW